MHNNYYFLRQLSSDLATFLPGFIFSECYSQSKNELILIFEKDNQEFTIKAHLQPEFCCLYFPVETSRAKRNSVNLFQEALELKVRSVLQFRNERSFAIELEDGKSLLFKMHGNRSNVIMCQGNEASALFNNKLTKDWNISLGELHRDFDTSMEAFLSADGNYKKIYPTLGNLPASYLREADYDSKSPEEKWVLLNKTISELEEPRNFLVIELEEKPALSLLALGILQKSFESARDALNHFFISYTREYTLKIEKQAALQNLKKEIRSGENYIEKTGAKLVELQKGLKNREIADIIMANLHNIKKNCEEVNLYDFYHDQDVSIKLKRDLSPQKNAENYYRKGKNQQMEENFLKENIQKKEEKIFELQLLCEEIEKIQSLKDLRSLIKSSILQESLQKAATPLPYREYEIQGYQIWIGKGAAQNDTLLRYHSHKNDLWLHAKDVSGSHVIVKRKGIQNVPSSVKEKAAALAAWYSKRKSDSLCPVICTSRKWIRKLKGAPAGMVIVDKEEEVILVKPTPFQDNQK